MKMNKKEKMVANASLSAGFGFGILFVCIIVFSVVMLGTIHDLAGPGWAVAAGVALSWLLFSKSFEKITKKMI